ncbi:hypothetical protein [Pseudonocardia sp. TRM90224]|uniref:hypothetical protein n=1 Tax=Pseudonocardia sp. TRM90224 TaxID=2812678 RepID=UPI001E288E77|nr:hypothetical protein [Pseudonocardia sp. TRM90224]
MSSHASRRIRIIAVVIGAAVAVGAGIAAPALAAPALPAAPVPAPIDGLGVLPDLDAPGIGTMPELGTPEGLTQLPDAAGALTDGNLVKADNTTVTTAGDELPAADADSIRDTGQEAGKSLQQTAEDMGVPPLDSGSLIGGLPAVPGAPLAPQN